MSRQRPTPGTGGEFADDGVGVPVSAADEWILVKRLSLAGRGLNAADVLESGRRFEAAGAVPERLSTAIERVWLRRVGRSPLCATRRSLGHQEKTYVASRVPDAVICRFVGTGGHVFSPTSANASTVGSGPGSPNSSRSSHPTVTAIPFTR